MPEEEMILLRAEQERQVVSPGEVRTFRFSVAHPKGDKSTCWKSKDVVAPRVWKQNYKIEHSLGNKTNVNLVKMFLNAFL